MLPLVHRPRDPNGFVKFASCDVQLNLNVKSPPWCSICPLPSLIKAATTDDWETNLVSNKIKIVGFTYSLIVEAVIPYNGQYPTSTPVRMDLLRFDQATSNEIYNRYTGSHTTGNWYLKTHSFTVPSTINNTISICSPVNIPLARPLIGNAKWYDTIQKDIKQNIPIKYNNDQPNTSAYRFDTVLFSNTVKVDCLLNIADDGNPATTIPLNSCLGEVPELFVVTYWNNRFTSSPFPLTSCFTVTGTLGIIYQDIGTKLSHL